MLGFGFYGDESFADDFVEPMDEVASALTGSTGVADGVALAGGGDAASRVARVPSAAAATSSRGSKREFTPDVICYDRCLARVWNGGLGGQCSRRAMDGRDVCKKHADGQFHGLVTHDVPPAKLREFRKRKAKLDAGLVVASKQTRGRVKKMYYARNLMWHEAQKLDTPERQADREQLRSIADLEEEEFNLCLERVHKYVTDHVGQQKHIEKSKGSQSFADYKANPDLAEYNGIGGGRVFRWYSRAIFERHLRTMHPLWCGPPRQVHEGDLTERQCMQALRATSSEIQRFPSVFVSMVEYSGPQCFPHVSEPGRREANAQVFSSRRTADEEQKREASGGFRGKWRCCDDCKRWRYLSQNAAAVFDRDACLAACYGNADWGAWLKAAPARYRSFQAQNDRMKAEDGGVEEGVAELEVQDEALSEAGRVEAGDAASESGSGGVASDSEGSLAKSGSASDAASSTASRGTACVLEQFGARGGGLRDEEREFLEQAPAGKSTDVLESMLLPEERVGAVADPERKLAFRCNMLSSLVVEEGTGKASWRGMVCEDGDDFHVLLQNAAGEALFHFSVGDTVLLMHAEVQVPPSMGECFSRLAQVRSVELASLDAKIQKDARGDMQEVRTAIACRNSEQDSGL